MKKTKLIEGVKRMRFNDIYTKWQNKRLTAEQAAEILGVHKRTFRRQCRSYEGEKANGLYDARLDKIAHNAAPVDEVIKLLTLFDTRYPTFTIKHFYDKWIANHDGARSYAWVKNQLQNSGLTKKTTKRGTHRRKRPRKPLPGMMLHQDGSTHFWVPNVQWDLIVTMDDANSQIYSAFFVEQEGTWSSFNAVKEVIESHGLFCTLYTDRGSHYWNTPTVGSKVDKNNLTQFGRAMRQLGVNMIPAYSPEARGRSERMFRTLQDRLVKELALNNITTIDAANKFLRECFIADFNKLFMVKPEEVGSAFISWLQNNHLGINDILCIQEKRTVNKDNTVSYKNKVLQIPADQYRYHYIKTEVQINEYEDGSCAIFYGPRKLAEYNVNGDLKSSFIASKKIAVCN